MKHYAKWLLLPALLMLSACNDDNNSSDTSSTDSVTVEALPSGFYTVSTGDKNDPSVGQYYSDGSGNHLLVLDDSGDQAVQVYQQQDGDSWEATPAVADGTSVSLLRYDAVLGADSIEPGSLAGTYVAQTDAGLKASFTISSTGVISTNVSDCELSGELSASSMPDVLKLSLNTNGCGSLPASSSGFLLVDKDYAPAAFRLLSTSDQQIVDLWSYSE